MEHASAQPDSAPTAGSSSRASPHAAAPREIPARSASSSRPRRAVAASGRWASSSPGAAQDLFSSQSLPAAERPRSALWRVVEASVRAAASINQRRAERDADEARIHADELSGWARLEIVEAPLARTPAAADLGSAGQWDSLAALFDEPTSPARGRREPSRDGSALSPMRHRMASRSGTMAEAQDGSTGSSSSDSRMGRATGPPGAQAVAGPRAWARFLSPTRGTSRSGSRDVMRSPSKRSDGRAESVSDEPDSYLSADPEHIPRGEDPLAWGEHKHLLDDNSEDEEARLLSTLNTAPARPRSGLKWWLHDWYEHMANPSAVTKDVLKCCIAYLLASLFTYSPLLSQWMADILPDRDGKTIPISNLFMVATVVVYFHPGRSIGSMLESDIFALAAFAYSVGMGLASMLTAVALHEAGLPLLSNIVVVLLFIGLAMALVGYARAKFVRPAFASACSLIGVILFTVVVKEGSASLGQFETDKVYDVTLVVIMGVIVTNSVCLLLWPQSACTNLERDIQRNLQGFATLLRVLTKTFLLDDPSQFNIRSENIKRASDNLHSSFTSLKKNLAEAKLEAPFDWRLRGQIDNYVRVVDAMNGLALHLGGLRSSCSLQHDIMAAQREERAQAQAAGRHLPPHEPGTAVAGALSGRPLTMLIDEDELPLEAESEEPTELEQRIKAFNAFLEGVGPHMRSLVFTCARSLNGMRETFKSSKDSEPGEDAGFEALARDVNSALKRFQHEQDISTKRLYTIYPLAERGQPSESSLGASPGFQADEEVFVIFYFLFLLEEFARSLSSLVLEMEKIRVRRIESERSPARWWWLLQPWRFLGSPERSRRRRAPKKGLLRRFADVLSITSGPTPPNWPSHKRHQPNTEQTPTARTFKQRADRLVWRLGQFLREPDVKFALKAAIGCCLLATPAFVSSTRPTFVQYQGQWCLVTYMVILQPTMGQSNNIAFQQILGTVIGASMAYAARLLFDDDWVALPLFGFLCSLPCFNYIVSKPARASAGRFSIVTYNLVALYSYTLRGEGMDVEELAIRRAVAVVIGVVSASVMNQLVWPFEARRELAHGLSELLFNFSALYQRLVLAYGSQPPREETQHAADDDSDVEEQRPLLESALTGHDDIEKMELHLQVQLIKLEALLAQTRNEPRLKGPFPVGTYRRYLGCCQNILDKLHAMRRVTSRRDWHTRVRRDFVVPVDATGVRREMVGNVLLFFYLLGSAFNLKTPLPPYLPPAERSRQALLDAIRELPAVKRRAVRGSSAYLLYFSYALSMKDLIHQLEEIGQLTQGAFGVLGGSVEAFEAQFRRGDGSAATTPWQTPRASTLVPDTE